MMESIGTPEIIDIAIVGAVVLLAASGFWRGVIKELFISAALLISYLVTLEWAARWGKWIGDQTRLSTAEGQYVAFAGTIAVLTVLLGYVGCTIAGLPPADLPGRFGGLVLGAANGVFVVAVLITRARQLVLDRARRQTLAETRIGDWLSANLDWVILALAAAGAFLLLCGLVNRRRRLALVTMAGAPPAGASGFRIRRPAPLAPEAEKIDGSPAPGAAALESWPDQSSMVDTVPITRVADPSRRADRPAVLGRTTPTLQTAHQAQRNAMIRCVSCGERITENDRYCPRCGRMLIAG